MIYFLLAAKKVFIPSLQKAFARTGESIKKSASQNCWHKNVGSVPWWLVSVWLRKSVGNTSDIKRSFLGDNPTHVQFFGQVVFVCAQTRIRRFAVYLHERKSQLFKASTFCLIYWPTNLRHRPFYALVAWPLLTCDASRFEMTGQQHCILRWFTLHFAFGPQDSEQVNSTSSHNVSCGHPCEGAWGRMHPVLEMPTSESVTDPFGATDNFLYPQYEYRAGKRSNATL